MAENYGFFNAQLVDGSPDRTYDAADFAAYYSRLISNGVFANPTNNLQVVRNSNGTNVATVRKGAAYINGYWYDLTEDTTINFEANLNQSSYRWDSVLLTLDLTTRQITLSVKKGTWGTSAPDPGLIREGSVYQLCIAQVAVRYGGNILTSHIYDRRGNTNLCGFVASTVQHLESTELFAQYDDIFYQWFNSAKYKLDNSPAGKLQQQIDEVYHGVSRYAKAILGSSGSMFYKQLYQSYEQSQSETRYYRGLAFAGFSQDITKEFSDSGIEISVPSSGPSATPDMTIMFKTPGIYRFSLQFSESLTLISQGIGEFKICLTNSDGTDDLVDFTPIPQGILQLGSTKFSSQFESAPWFSRELIVAVTNSKLNIPYRLALKTESLGNYMTVSTTDIPLIYLNIDCLKTLIEVQQDLVYQVHLSRAEYNSIDPEKNTLYFVTETSGIITLYFGELELYSSVPTGTLEVRVTALENQLNGISIQECTQAEYDDMETHDEHTLYLVTDNGG